MSSPARGDDFYDDRRIAETYDLDPDLPRDDVPFYVDLAREAGRAGQGVLELGCGTGRVTIPIADAGVAVAGLDRAAEMLAVARGKTEGRANPRWLQAGMADFELDERFGLAIIPYRSFCLLLTVAEQKACLARIREHLVAGGRLALNFFNPDLVTMAFWLNHDRGLWQSLSPYTTSAGLQLERWATRSYRTASQSIEETRIEDALSDDGAIISRVTHGLRLRYIFRYEMEHLLALSGFEVEALYGWFDRRPFTDESSEMVWIARKG